MKCRIRDSDVYYEMCGTGRPIISLHGFTLDHRSMLGCMEPIFEHRDGWKRIYLDLPGHGKTPGQEWIKNSDDMLQLLVEFIDEVIPDMSFTVVGLSYGGYLARGLIHQRPAQVDGLLLIVPRIISRSEDRTLPEKVVLVSDPELLSSLGDQEREDFEEVAVVQTRSHWTQYSKVITPGVRLADMKFLDRLQPAVDEFSFDVDSRSTTFDAPTLILVGRQDHWVGYQDTWKILEKYPRATFAVLDRTGHALQLEQTELFNALVSEWLDRVAEK
ncbi:MAG: alpha/beta hydrolase [Candidatus Thorarchaeota archaeon]|nr:MAG: alpha/beta hydrolase [Candidatus Thorarchaeota archaeon]